MIQTVAEMNLSTPPSTLRFVWKLYIVYFWTIITVYNKVQSFLDINIFL